MKNQQKKENLIHQLNDLIDTNIFLIKKIKNSNDKKAKKKYKSNELKIKETLKDLIQSEIKNIDRDNKSRNAKELLALISYIQKIDSIYFNKDDCFYCGFTIDQCRCNNLLKKKSKF